MEKVVVAITTYNLKDYIAQALDSILCQKTDFSFRIVVADDCSTDGTVGILQDYAQRYPDIIQVITSDKNMGSLANSNRIFRNLACEYFSFLDGDDYWLTEDRLQRQVDFLDSHKEYSMCGGNTYQLKGGNFEPMIEEKALNQSYTFSDYVNGTIPFVHTSSLVVRNSIFSKGLPLEYSRAVGTFEDCALRGEDFRRLIHLQKGPMFVFDDVFSVYRIHDKGIWQGSSFMKRLLEVTIAERFYAKYFGDIYNGHFIDRYKKSYASLLKYLIEEHYLFPQCRLNEKECYLFTGYLNDCSKDSQNPLKSLVKLKLRTFLLRLVIRLTK